MNELIRCPRCGSYVYVTYVDTAGAHWTCPNCFRNSDNYTLIYDSKTHMYKELNTDTNTKLSRDATENIRDWVKGGST